MTTTGDVLEIAEDALQEAHGWCQEYGRTSAHRGDIAECPQHREAWATVQRAKPTGSEADPGAVVSDRDAWGY